MKVLITGGAGFIGSTIASACADDGITPVILDNLVTGRREFAAPHAFYEGDIADGDLIDKVFAEHRDIYAVIHCASLIVVPESVANPLAYYSNNLAGSIALLGHLARNRCDRLIFSSSASIYRPSEDDFTVDEDSPLAPASPYAHTKAMAEQILKDTATAGGPRSMSLRYFNPIGADPQLRTGLQVLKPTHALGRMIDAHHSGQKFTITGTDWPTPDGTCVRDYVHVWDLADAHLRALHRFDQVLPTDGTDRHQVIILGAGKATTVRELVNAFGEVTGRPLPVVETARRPGDTVGAYSRSTRAKDLLGWEPQHTITDGIRDSLRWYDKRDTLLTADG
ncbi:UDP-glucose 4-epimerase GalE [Streptomyces sp. NPDC049577]|uniref:UDP-glucose 4-epimerase GalE n=1 Tax=Streptomyces sp. NPDC049577 TaxID=3155153 RepID=UPI00344227A6